MPSFREVKRRVRGPGFHCHHVIPIEVIEKPVFRTLFRTMRELGFDFDDFRQNGLYLPCTEENAAAFRLPMHRGPHPVYNQVVSERISAIEGLGSHIQLLELYRLQGALKAALRNNEVSLRKGRRNPMAANVDFEPIEIAAYRLWNLMPSH